MAPSTICAPSLASSATIRVMQPLRFAQRSRPAAVRVQAAVAEAGTNAAEARAWIEAWRSKSGSGSGSAAKPAAKKAVAGEMINYSAKDLSKVNLEEALAKLSKK